MLHLSQLLDNVALLTYEALEKPNPEITDWSTTENAFSLRRSAFILLPNGWNEAALISFLSTKKLGRIYNIVSHNPILAKGDTFADLDILADRQRIVIDGEPYIDMFGLHVYIASRVSWEYQSDVDMRFDTNRYPYHHLEPEIRL